MIFIAYSKFFLKIPLVEDDSSSCADDERDDENEEEEEEEEDEVNDENIGYDDNYQYEEDGSSVHDSNMIHMSASKSSSVNQDEHNDARSDHSGSLLLPSSSSSASSSSRNTISANEVETRFLTKKDNRTNTHKFGHPKSTDDFF